jgi:antitoxin component YwqK of YwqJK toxin-antitoxin module
MKGAAILIFVLIGMLLHSQEEFTNQTDNQGRKIGKWVGKHDDGSLRYEGQFRNDRPFGEFRYFYPSGKVRAINQFSMNGRVAHNRTFFEKGQLMAKGKYVAQKKDSTWRFYSEVDGALISEDDYQDDLLHGKVRNYYPETGILAELMHYNEGQREGVWEKYFPDGSLMTKGTYKNDLLNGKLIIFHPSGKVQISGSYENGVRTGTWFTYDQDGKLIEEETYD